MRNLILSLSSSSLAALALVAPAQAQAFPGGFPGAFPAPFSPGSMGQLDRMCDQNRNENMHIFLPGVAQTGTGSTIDGDRSWTTNCANALDVYNNLGRAGFKAQVDATRAIAAAQSQSAMIGGIGSIFSGIISAASNRNTADGNAQQQTIAAQQQQIDQLKQMIIAQQAAQPPAYTQQQPQLASHQQTHYQYHSQPAPRPYNTYQPQQASLRQTNLF